MSKQHFERGLHELDRYLFHFEDAALPRAVKSLRRAAELAPQHVESWVALGYALDAAEASEDALAALRKAHALSPEDEEVDVFIVTLLCESGPEVDALEAVQALAKRHSVDLETLRSELRAAEMPADASTLVLNGFIRARNYVRSRLEDRIARIARTGEALTAESSDRAACADFQKELATNWDSGGVPEPLAALAPWALRLGIGDDVCRGMLMSELKPAERAELGDLVERQGPTAHEWLDSFGDAPMSAEASAVMYLLLGVEESRPSPS